ncbi:hypothetical protein TNCT_319791 [Trichonephila clavata]|uniref:Uncharacterized protein n=1 Tax=Trichonephila clavata TaxID=2740835 RepID=A0A8X6HWD8_TRICU|nr:hypothetical protein TNCT_319791 [Trichonephila clavata]
MSKVEKGLYSLFSDGTGNGGDGDWVAGTDLCSRGGGDGAPLRQLCPQECDSQTESSPLSRIPRRSLDSENESKHGSHHTLVPVDLRLDLIQSFSKTTIRNFSTKIQTLKVWYKSL